MAASRVLVADDDPSVCDLLQRMFVGGGWDVVVVGSGLDAIDAVENGEPFELIVLDHYMQGLSGVEVAQRLLAEHPHRRIVLLTGYLDEAVTQLALAAGVTACVDKTQTNMIVQMAGTWAGRIDNN